MCDKTVPESKTGQVILGLKKSVESRPFSAFHQHIKLTLAVIGSDSEKVGESAGLDRLWVFSAGQAE